MSISRNPDWKNDITCARPKADLGGKHVAERSREALTASPCRRLQEGRKLYVERGGIGATKENRAR
jgi:hypothetical protein